MKAAVVRDFAAPPRYEEFDDLPDPRGDEIPVDVLAAAVSQRVRSQANGSHYSSAGALPIVPGVDGVGRTAAGELRYFVAYQDGVGALAQRALTSAQRSVALPPGADPVPVAAAMNPAMSSWLALRCRAGLQPGQRVLVLGATGASGRLAVPIARQLGAGWIAAAGRGAARLAQLHGNSADQLIALDGDPADVARQLAQAGARVDIVLDYLWGEPTASAMRAIVPHRADDDQPLHWVQIGSIAGATAPIPGAALRATNLRLLGSGQGSVPPRQIVRELGELASVVVEQQLSIPTRTVPLAEIERAWTEPAENGERLVIVP